MTHPSESLNILALFVMKIITLRIAPDVLKCVIFLRELQGHQLFDLRNAQSTLTIECWNCAMRNSSWN